MCKFSNPYNFEVHMLQISPDALSDDLKSSIQEPCKVF